MGGGRRAKEGEGGLTDSVSLDGMLWPRACAAAEVLWRGPGRVSDDVTRRLAEMRERQLGWGFGAEIVQVEWYLSPCVDVVNCTFVMSNTSLNFTLHFVARR